MSASRLSLRSSPARSSRANVTRASLLALGLGVVGCGSGSDWTEYNLQALTGDAQAPNDRADAPVAQEAAVDSGPTTDVVDAAMPVDSGTDTGPMVVDVADAGFPDVVMVDTGTDTGPIGVDAVDAGFPDRGVVDSGTDTGVDTGTPDAGTPDTGPADAGFPCRPVSMTVSGDNINNSYDSQGAVQVVIDTTGDCDSLRGTMLPFTINYGVSASVLRPVLQVDNAAHQVRTSLDFTDPTLVAFPREYNSVRAETTVAGTRVSTVFNRDITPPSITAATFGGVSVAANNYGFRLTSNSAGLIGIDARNDSGMSIFNHGSMASCSFTPEGTGCDEVAPDGSGRSQRCFMPNMLTGQRVGTCDISEGRVINYLSPGVNSLNMLNRTDYQQVIARVPVRSHVTFVVYVTDQALNVSTASYRVAVE